MRRRYLLVTLLTALNSVGFAGSVTGTVRDALTSAPIGGAFVSVHILLPDSIGIYDTTDVTGAYAIANIPQGNQIYVILTYAPGYRGYYFRFADLGSGTFDMDVLLEPEQPPPPGGGGDSTGVSGFVMGHTGPGGSLVSVEGATVELKSGLVTNSIMTDANGHYVLRVKTGSYGILVSAPGYQSVASSGVAVTSTGLTYGAVLKGVGTDVGETGIAPASFALLDPYPNPFNPTTVVSCQLPAVSSVKLTIYDVLGREVITLLDEVKQPGTYAVTWNASQCASGVYYCRMAARRSDGGQPGVFIKTRNVIVMK